MFFFLEFPYTIFECLGACFTNILNTKNILNMNIEGFEYEHRG